ncbi:hypothetical protein EYF80_003809 [Liparis tanakae]|uniref:Uncharacterized protein n=1 Tax=Liparis tanakae TaxID=230148 RepID=A0A4Z2J6F0_9TELE|nr:hypothetical protein EYF80_003809 [Liparis tanakae]
MCHAASRRHVLAVAETCGEGGGAQSGASILDAAASLSAAVIFGGLPDNCKVPQEDGTGVGMEKVDGHQRREDLERRKEEVNRDRLDIRGAEKEFSCLGDEGVIRELCHRATIRSQTAAARVRRNVGYPATRRLGSKDAASLPPATAAVRREGLRGALGSLSSLCLGPKERRLFSTYPETLPCQVWDEILANSSQSGISQQNTHHYCSGWEDAA